MTNEAVMKNTGFQKVQSLDQIKIQHEKWMINDEPHLGVWAVEFIEDKKFLGWCMLKKIDENKVELGYMSLPEYWGKGYMSELALFLKEYAHTKINYPQVIAMVNRGNIASVKILKKIQMSKLEYDEKNNLDVYESKV